MFNAVVPSTQVFITSFIFSVEDNVWQDFIPQRCIVCSVSSCLAGVTAGGLFTVA